MKVLRFLRLVDDDGVLSLTNIAVMVILVKMAGVQVHSLTDITALITVLLSYQGKRYLTKDKNND